MGYDLLSETEYDTCNTTIEDLANKINGLPSPEDNVKEQEVDSSAMIKEISMTLAKNEPDEDDSRQNYTFRCLNVLRTWVAKLPEMMEGHHYRERMKKFIDWLGNKTTAGWNDGIHDLKIADAEEAVLQILKHSRFRRFTRFWKGRFPFKVLSMGLFENLIKASRIYNNNFSIKKESVNKFINLAASRPWLKVTQREWIDALGFNKNPLSDAKLSGPLGNIMCRIRIKHPNVLSKKTTEYYLNQLQKASYNWTIDDVSGKKRTLDGICMFFATHQNMDIKTKKLLRILKDNRKRPLTPENLPNEGSIHDLMAKITEQYPKYLLSRNYQDMLNHIGLDRDPDEETDIENHELLESETADIKYEEEVSIAPNKEIDPFNKLRIGSLNNNNRLEYDKRIQTLLQCKTTKCTLAHLLDKIIVKFKKEYIINQDKLSDSKTVEEHMLTLTNKDYPLDSNKAKTTKKQKTLKLYEEYIKIATKVFFQLDDNETRRGNTKKKDEIQKKILKNMGNIKTLQAKQSHIDAEDLFGDINIKQITKNLADIFAEKDAASAKKK